MIGVAIFAVFALAPQVKLLYDQQVQISDLQKQNAATKASIDKMSQDLKRWDDPAYVRAQARDRLYYVMPGEISFLVMDAGSVNKNDTSNTVGSALAAAKNSSTISAKVTTTKTNWASNLTSSIIGAGLVQPK